MSARFLLPMALLISSAAFAYPIAPAPLWRLVADAEVIVLATVVAVDEPTQRELRRVGDDEFEDPGQETARLRVIEHWKGETETDLEVPFEANMVCPAPPRYEVGATVLAFLSPEGEDKAWTTVHLSYGTLYPTPQDLPVFASRVKEALALQRGKILDRGERIEWLVRCAEDRATRWHGLYELGGSPGPFAYDDVRVRVPAELLTDEHRRRIVSGFLSDPLLDYTVRGLLDVIGTYTDPRLDRALVTLVDHELESKEPDPYLLLATIPAILARLGDVDSETRMPSLVDDLEDGARIDAVRNAWSAAKQALALPRK